MTKQIKQKFYVGAISAIVCLSIGCGPNYQFNRAKKLERKGQFYKAWTLYQEFSSHYPTHSAAAEAVFRSGWLAQTKLGDCFMAGTFYDTVLEKYPQSEPWAKAAQLQKDNCPDYFPFLPGSKWVMGDSDTGGKNARIEIEAKTADKGTNLYLLDSARLVRSYFSGEKKFDTKESLIKKKDSELQEFPSPNDPVYKVPLKWPVIVGNTWSYKYGKQLFKNEVVSTDATIKVIAGEFTDCLKVKTFAEGYPGVKFDYYAPSVGLILSAQDARGEEKRITELLQFDIKDDEAPSKGN